MESAYPPSTTRQRSDLLLFINVQGLLIRLWRWCLYRWCLKGCTKHLLSLLPGDCEYFLSREWLRCSSGLGGCKLGWGWTGLFQPGRKRRDGPRRPGHMRPRRKEQPSDCAHLVYRRGCPHENYSSREWVIVHGARKSDENQNRTNS